MQWSADDTIPAIQSKSLELRELFAKAANASLDKGFSKEESIFAGTGAVKIHERKNAPAKAKIPKVPSHVESLRSYTAPFEVVNKVVEQPATVKAAEFDAQGHLVILMSDGTKVQTKGKAAEQHIDQRIGVSVNPVFDHVQMNITANYPSAARQTGMLTWNADEDCLDIVQADGSTLQTGLEHYALVVNSTANTLLNGTVVRYSGVSTEETLQAVSMIADGSVQPLHLIGITTNSIAPGKTGRVTILGKVRNINTTGSSSNETWLQGDLLWAHPQQPGMLTKVRPTAPSVSISVAIVLKVNSTSGILFVRPVIFPRMYYGVFSSSVTQAVSAINTASYVNFQTTETNSGVRIVNSKRFYTDHAGLYSFDFRLQMTTTGVVDPTSTGIAQKTAYIWGRKNNADIARSSSRITVLGEGAYFTPSWSFTVSMEIGDYFELMYAVDNLTLVISAPAQTTFSPNTPSATMRVSQINL